MKRRTALTVLASLPAVAANKQGTWSNPRKLDTNSTEYYEAQFLALFVALLSKDNSTGATKLDKFLSSGGNIDTTDVYFKYSTKEAFSATYQILKTQGLDQKVINFQNDFRDLSALVVTAMSKGLLQSPYPKVCPTDFNMQAILKSL
jgi:hypothetical protein